MYVIDIYYIVLFECIDDVFECYCVYLQLQFDKGIFIVVGLKVLCVGGMIFVVCIDCDVFDVIFEIDLFVIEGFVMYCVMEFWIICVVLGFNVLVLL